MEQQSLIRKQADKSLATKRWSTKLWVPIAASLLVAFGCARQLKLES